MARSVAIVMLAGLLGTGCLSRTERAGLGPQHPPLPDAVRLDPIDPTPVADMADCMVIGTCAEDGAGELPALPPPPPRPPLAPGASCEEIADEARWVFAHHPESELRGPSCAAGLPSLYEASAAGAKELHVVSVHGRRHIYDAASGLEEAAPVRVVVKRGERPIVLALSADENIHWIIEVEADAELAWVYVQGMAQQRVTGVPNHIPVSDTPACDCGYAWEAGADGGECDFGTMITQVRAETGLYESSFQGCAAADSFTVPAR